MDSTSDKNTLDRLIAEARGIAPSISNFAEFHNYGMLTDENLDTQNFLRWEIEARSILEDLARTGPPSLRELYTEYKKMKEEASRYHSKSIVVHKTLEMLQSARQLAPSLTAPTRYRSGQSDWRALILTALGLETTAVLSHLTDVKETRSIRGTVFYEGSFDGNAGAWLVRVAEVGLGNASSAVTAERAISDFNPAAAIFIGIGGGIKDVDLGDVVAATLVYGYERGKATAEGFNARPDAGRSTYALEQRARAVMQTAKWPDRIKGKRSRVPRGFVGPIAAGEKVIASERASISRFLREHYGDALAVEMEGRGFLETIHMNPGVAGLVVRGISDRLSGKRESDSAGWQPIAAENAAAFAFEILATYDWPRKDPEAPAEKKLRHRHTPKDAGFKRSATVDHLIDAVVPGDHDTSDAAALALLMATESNGSNRLFEALLRYQNCPDPDMLWKALPLIESSIRLAPWLIESRALRRMGAHKNFSVRSSAASICMDLAEYAPDRVPIDLILRLSVYDEDWYVQAPANAALKTMSSAMPGVLRIFFIRLQSKLPEEREHAAHMLADIANMEPELLDLKELRSELTRLKREGDKGACAYLTRALAKVRRKPRRKRYKYGL